MDGSSPAQPRKGAVSPGKAATSEGAINGSRMETPCAYGQHMEHHPYTSPTIPAPVPPYGMHPPHMPWTGGPFGHTMAASPYPMHGGPQYGCFTPGVPMLRHSQESPSTGGRLSTPAQPTPAQPSASATSASGDGAPEVTSPGVNDAKLDEGADEPTPQPTHAAQIDFDIPTAGSPTRFSPPLSQRADSRNSAHLLPPAEWNDPTLPFNSAVEAASMARAAAASAELQWMQMRLATMYPHTEAHRYLPPPQSFPPPYPPPYPPNHHPLYPPPHHSPYQAYGTAQQGVPNYSSPQFSSPLFHRQATSMQRLVELSDEEARAARGDASWQALPPAAPLPPPTGSLLDVASSQQEVARQVLDEGTGNSLGDQKGPALLVENASASREKPRPIVRV